MYWISVEHNFEPYRFRNELPNSLFSNTSRSSFCTLSVHPDCVLCGLRSQLSGGETMRAPRKSPV
jgi:hypothetical protein